MISEAIRTDFALFSDRSFLLRTRTPKFPGNFCYLILQAERSNQKTMKGGLKDHYEVKSDKSGTDSETF